MLPAIIVLNVPVKLCQERNSQRPDRDFGPHVTRQHSQALRRSLRGLKREGFRHITVLERPEDIEAVTVERQPLWNNRRSDRGPFDIIGDVHGCFDELTGLLEALGYEVSPNPAAPHAHHPDGRRALFVGDLVDRGPNSPGVLRLVMSMVEAGTGMCVPGNHDVKLMRKLRGRDVRITHGLAETLAQLDNETDDFKEAVAVFIDGLVSHYVFDDGNLVVSHAGLKEDLQGRASARVREFALYGETTGETDEFGLPVRYDWASEYRGRATVVYGHTPVPEPEWINRTICIDTGCVFGGHLTALRYPEKELVQVPAKQTYYAPVRPFLKNEEDPAAVAQRPYDDLLDINDVMGKRIVQTRVHHNVTVRQENAAAALEVMSRFAVDPRWLIYLPPTMAPSDTAKEGDFLEHPAETFAYFRQNGVAQVMCQEKHMGSRAVVVLCASAEAARRRFGTVDETLGVIYTRTGRPFFNARADESQVLTRLNAAMERSGLWTELESDWVCLDVEIMPWSAKARALLQTQYAPAGSSASSALDAALALLRSTPSASTLRERFEARRECVSNYVEAYQRYCWPVSDVSDLKIAPFHLLASEHGVHVDQNHAWHMQKLSSLCAADEALLHRTAHRIVDTTAPQNEIEATEWWTALTAAGGEGIVVKPLDWISKGRKGLVQPALKCRGRSYLRIIYGPEYTLPEHLERLRDRNLSRKRSLALREFALGVEGLHRFVEREPLYRVHECAFGVLALESEPVDPRL